MRIFITGATGFIGGRLTEKLIGDGHYVVLLVRNPVEAGLKETTGMTIIRGDLDDKEALKSGMKGCHLVLHLAAFTRPYSGDPGVSYNTNVTGTGNVLEAASVCSVKRIVLTSTGGTFSYSSNGETVDESSVPAGAYHTEYERTKAEAEKLVHEFCEKGLEVIIVNPTRIFGPGKLTVSNSVTRIIYWYMKGIWRFVPGNGKAIGNYVYIDDVVNGIMLAAEKGRPGEKYILGGENITFRELFSYAGSASGRKRFMVYLPEPFLKFIVKLMMLFATIMRREPLITTDWLNKYLKDWIMSSRKAETELGYKITPVSTGIYETVKWLRSKNCSNER